MIHAARDFACAVATLAALTCNAASPLASLRLCDGAAASTVQQQDRMLRFAALAQRELDASGDTVAVVSRNGTDLSRFGIRYSHAGVSLKANRNGPWSVRQLYYACDERRPRLFDQGLPGFVLGTDNPATGYLSIVLLPADAAARIEPAALDDRRALRLLASTYSANAHPFSVRYQNCNQWLIELLAAAWAPLEDTVDLRARAQQWLAENRYDPAPVQVGSHLLMFIAPFVPMIHVDDHPTADQFALHFRTSLPDSIETFVHERVPGARRVEMCHDAQRVVVHHGWDRMADGCTPGPADTVIDFD